MIRLFGVVVCLLVIPSLVLAFDLSVPEELVFSSEDDQRVLLVEVSDSVVYQAGYLSFDGGASWEEVAFSGVHSIDAWVVSSASLSRSLTFTDFSGEEGFIALFSCSWSEKWDCHGGDWRVVSFAVSVDEPFVPPEEGSVESDRQALVDLYEATNGGSWSSNTGWLSSNDLGAWFGVETDSDGRVTRIDLRENNLVGSSLPDSLGSLSRLEFLALKNNHITGASLPSAWGSGMQSLQELYLAGTRSMPDERFGKHPGKSHTQDNQITNYFVGELPSSWGNWPRIERLELVGSELEGFLPSEWGSLSTLRGLYLNNNGLEGFLPSEWAGMSLINHLFLEGNHFEGELPVSWGEGMRYVSNLRLSGNPHLTGPVPDEWSNMRMLWIFTLGPGSGNAREPGITGSFPQFIGNGDFHQRVVTQDPDPDARPVEAYHSGLGTMAMNFNSFDGPWPDLSKMTWVNVFNVYGSNLGGAIPADFAKLTRLIQVDLTSNGLSGEVPDLSSLGVLRFINVPNNGLEGSLPDLRTSNAAFRNSQWQNNRFSGSIPDSWNFPGSNNIFRLWLNNNDLSGPIPPRLAESGHSYSSEFRLQNNRYVFADLVPFIELGPNNFVYAPQKPFGRSSDRSGSVIDFSSRVSHSGNRYQWYRNGDAVSGATSRSIDTSQYGSGVYQLLVENPGAPDLLLESIEIII